MPPLLRARPLRPLLSISCAVFAPASLSAAALHVLEPVSFDSFDYSLGIAADGTVVGCSDNFDTILPVSWARSGAGYGAASPLPLISGGESGEARWTSPDASLIGGRVSVAAPDGDLPDHRPVVWTRTGAGTYAAAALPRLGAAPADATVSTGTATGARFVGHDGADSTAALWRRTGAGYTVQALPAPGAANGPSFATAISADGTRIVGRYTVDENAQAVVWTETGPASFSHRVLQTLPDGAESFANVISLDGALAAGASDSANGLVAVKWDTATGAATALENLPGDYGTVRAISEDSYWLGGSSNDSDTFASSAVLWDHEGKIHDLATLAAEAGAAFEGFTPESVTGIHLVSTGLYTIVGTGVSINTGFTQGFVLENLALFAPIPEPATTPAIVGSATLGGVYMSRRRRLAAPPVPAPAAGETAPASRTLGSSTRAPRSAR